jgi:hypothetical protein
VGLTSEELFPMSYTEIYEQNIWTYVYTRQTYELVCTHDKHHQIDWQKRVSVLIPDQGMSGKHICLCNMFSIDLLNPDLPVAFSVSPHSFLPSVTLCPRSRFHNVFELICSQSTTNVSSLMYHHWWHFCCRNYFNITLNSCWTSWYRKST